MITIHRGLEGVHVAQTRLSRVDGVRGELLLAGQSVEALAGHIDVGAAIERLWQTAGMDSPSRWVPHDFAHTGVSPLPPGHWRCPTAWPHSRPDCCC